MTDIPGLFGILNITTDSFSDGGAFLEPEKALEQALSLQAGGADIIDIGPASSHPDSAPVSAQTEIDRLTAIVPDLQSRGITVSIDSYQTQTQRWALQNNVDWMNDIHGFADPGFYPELASSDCRLIVMHAIQSAGAATRTAPPEGDIFDHICRFFDARLAALTKAGISQDRLVIDPGMGFFLGDRPEPSLTMLARIGDLKTTFGLPVLVSVSRKSFLRVLSGRSVSESAPVTLAAELWAAAKGADYIRTHDPSQIRDALKIQAHISNFVMN
ncbi:dihydropteroate synthase [alpha proteobacterium IMCC14465]|uniref:Dihydropteroate synthase n=1 Tax=alpha proteobacterium IMCC14465 TaxID=1220535 RepID=J9DWQ5_9PROT|nr:dihydropteroate synthase [alpha proteobacterium IMCC14465]